jgi:SAM-dependent MidA family methyltransferase
LNQVARIISQEIADRGAISFARFMELALYCPIHGYYEQKQDTIGRRGDFYTSVSVGSVFGELLAWQFAEWLSAIEVARKQDRVSQRGDKIHYSESTERVSGQYVPGEKRRMLIVEAGAHNGTLAKDILSWLRLYRPGVFEHLDYFIIEPSLRRRTWQEAVLVGLENTVQWVSNLHELCTGNQSNTHSPESSINGIIFANELLDSFPVHRYGWDAKKQEWFEWGVVVRDGEFAWTRLSGCGNPDLVKLPGIAPLTALREHLPEEFTIEVSPAAESWWREAARSLNQGQLLTFDYGLTSEELLAPERKHGTLRSYHQHQSGCGVLENPGKQDLTAHVNFQAIQEVGEQVGLQTQTVSTQEQFLTSLLAQACKVESSFKDWDSKRIRQFQTLIHPEHLGRRFRVLLQTRS